MKFEIGQRIRQVRVLQGLSQTAFAKLLGDMSTSTISSYEKGVILPQEAILEEIARVGGVSLEDLTEGSENFDNKIGRQALKIEGRRTRFSGGSSFPANNSSGSLRNLIDKLNSFQDSLESTLERLERQEQQMDFKLSNELEERLLELFRALPLSKQKRYVEDMSEYINDTGRKTE